MRGRSAGLVYCFVPMRPRSPKLSYWQGRILHELAFSILMIPSLPRFCSFLEKKVTISYLQTVCLTPASHFPSLPSKGVDFSMHCPPPSSFSCIKKIKLFIPLPKGSTCQPYADTFLELSFHCSLFLELFVPLSKG